MKSPSVKDIHFSSLESYHQQNVWSLNKSKLRWHFVLSEKFETKERAVARQAAVQLPAPTNQLLLAIAPVGSFSELLLASSAPAHIIAALLVISNRRPKQ